MQFRDHHQICERNTPKKHAACTTRTTQATHVSVTDIYIEIYNVKQMELTPCDDDDINAFNDVAKSSLRYQVLQLKLHCHDRRTSDVGQEGD